MSRETVHVLTADDDVGVHKVSLILMYQDTRVVPKVMSNFFFFACELGTADEGE